ncbi:MAG TPA: DUF1214 domain-containing protein [Mesorhizobium sp.]|jgi:hypothetical protein|nr:DUF1214 domain-containing protein [Mesorhizobium sp.]
MLKSVLLAVVTLAIAIGGGAASVWWMLERGLPARGWVPHANPAAANANPYVRAQLSRSGALTLGRAEGLSFIAKTDSTGEPFSANCDYLLEGPLPTARFWTLWAADPALNPLPARGPRPSALHSQQTLRSADGGMRVAASPRPQPGNWLLVGAPGPFTLVLTLYDTPAAGFQGAAPPALPDIVRTGCGA